MKKQVFTVIIAVVVAVILVLYLFSFQVRETEIAIVTTFGKPTSVKRAPGLYWKWPWPVQQIEQYDGRIHIFGDRLEETLTRDKKNILITACVGWQIGDVKQAGKGRDPALVFRESIGTMKSAEEKLKSVVGDRKSEVVGRYVLDQFVNVDKDKMKFAEIEETMLSEIVDFVHAEYGIDVVLFRINRLEFPANAVEAVQTRMKEERNREVEKFIARGEAEANEIRSGADRQKAQILALAKREAERIRGEGEKKVAEYSEIFNRYPDLANWLRTVRAMEEICKTRTTVVLDSKNSFVEALTKGIELSTSPGEAAGSSTSPKKGG